MMNMPDDHYFAFVFGRIRVLPRSGMASLNDVKQVMETVTEKHDMDMREVQSDVPVGFADQMAKQFLAMASGVKVVKKEFKLSQEASDFWKIKADNRLR